jgi:hypothetical protein
MVNAHVLDVTPRRAATVAGIDARLSAWGQATRDAVDRRVEVMIQAAQAYVEKVGRVASVLAVPAPGGATLLLDADLDAIAALLASVLPGAVAQSSRLLWVDPERLTERLNAALAPMVEECRAEIRRRQALYRRRARLWQGDQARLDRLRDEVEGMRVPRCGSASAERVARGLFDRHKDDPRLVASGGGPDISDARLKVRPGTITRWIAQLDERIASS